MTTSILSMSPTSTAGVTPMPASTGARRVPVSIVIPTLNEASRIEDALRELEWADEVIVVDGGSEDGTADLAAAAGARVLVLVGETIGAQRNHGIAAARNEWVLALDADERVTPRLQEEIAEITRRPVCDAAHSGYRIPFRNCYLGRELRHGPWGRDAHVRLFCRDRRFQTRRVHEHLEFADAAGELQGCIVHESYRSISHHVSKIVRYSEWAAEDMRVSGRRAGLVDVTLRPVWRFARDYVLYAGWRDGVPGFVAAVLSAFSVFLKYSLLLTTASRATPRAR